MSTLSWIILSGLLGGLLSILLAALLTLKARSSWLSILVSYAIGALLGAAFLNTLPEALELSDDPKQITMIVPLGIFISLLENLFCGGIVMEDCEAHDLGHNH